MQDSRVLVWVIDHQINNATLERLGDARLAADAWSTRVGILVVGESPPDPGVLIHYGADLVVVARTDKGGQNQRLQESWKMLTRWEPRLVLAAGDCEGREWAALLAARSNSALVSPALRVETRGEGMRVYALDESSRFGRRVDIDPGRSAILTFRSGVAEAVRPVADREGEINEIEAGAVPETVIHKDLLPADPKTVDIRFARCLVAGGRGVGSREGFATLMRFADQIDAGLAASRMAVDLGWVPFERQVGQTGKTVAPELYIACGISGASHHLEGMSDSKHIVAINVDSQAPIMKLAHLGLVADLHEVLREAVEQLSRS